MKKIWQRQKKKSEKEQSERVKGNDEKDEEWDRVEGGGEREVKKEDKTNRGMREKE